MTSHTFRCQHCGKEFKAKKSSKRKYCSAQCTYDNRISNRLIKKCKRCGKEFGHNHPPNYTKHYDYCGKSCAHLSMPKTGVKTCTCEWCGKEFETHKCRPGRFCSRACSGQFGARQPKPNAVKPEIHITLKCEVCGKDYQTTTHQKRLRNSRYCSRECQVKGRSADIRGANHPNYRGGKVAYRGRNWTQQKNAALKRDNSECQACGKKVDMKKWDYGIHHIIPYRDFNNDWQKANELTNLVTLCRSCHTKVEFGKMPCPRPLF